MHSGDWVWVGVYYKREISPPATSILTYLHHAAESFGRMEGVGVLGVDMQKGWGRGSWPRSLVGLPAASPFRRFYCEGP